MKQTSAKTKPKLKAIEPITEVWVPMNTPDDIVENVRKLIGQLLKLHPFWKEKGLTFGFHEQKDESVLINFEFQDKYFHTLTLARLVQDLVDPTFNILPPSGFKS